MPQPVGHNQDNSTAEETVLGVDTHKDVHVAAVLSRLGVLLSSANFPATAAGYRALLAWVSTFGVLRRAWSAPVPTVRRWPGTCGRPVSR
jgi:hypothetical protein